MYTLFSRMLLTFMVEVLLLFVVETHEFVHSSLTLNIDIDGSRPSSSGMLRRRRGGDGGEREGVRDIWPAHQNTCSNSLASYSPLIRL